MAADSNVQAARICAAWRNEASVIRNSKKEGMVKASFRTKNAEESISKDVLSTNLFRPRALLSLVRTGAVLHGPVQRWSRGMLNDRVLSKRGPRPF